MQAEQQSERERFEAWATHLDSEPPCFDKDRDGYYEDWDLQRAWRGWQARAALSHPSPQWLPIESAPKDGARVILAWGGKAINGFYLDNSKSSHPWEGWRVESMIVCPPGKPTLWQPFPQLPRGDV